MFILYTHIQNYFLASNPVLGPYFPENNLLNSDKKKVCIITLIILESVCKLEV